MSAILVRAKIATEIKTLSTREQWPDSAISQLTILGNSCFLVYLLNQIFIRFLLDFLRILQFLELF